MQEGEAPRRVDVDGMELHLDPEPDANGDIHTALPPRLESWRRRSAAGAILTGIGLGLKAALEPERDEPSIIVQTSGTPPSDLPVEADLGGIFAADKVVKIRPWLLAGDAPSGPVAAGPVGAAPVAAGPVGAGPVAAGPVAARPVAPGPPAGPDREGDGGAVTDGTP